MASLIRDLIQPISALHIHIPPASALGLQPQHPSPRSPGPPAAQESPQRINRPRPTGKMDLPACCKSSYRVPVSCERVTAQSGLDLDSTPSPSFPFAAPSIGQALRSPFSELPSTTHLDEATRPSLPASNSYFPDFKQLPPLAPTGAGLGDNSAPEIPALSNDYTIAANYRLPSSGYRSAGRNSISSSSGGGDGNSVQSPLTPQSASGNRIYERQLPSVFSPNESSQRSSFSASQADLKAVSRTLHPPSNYHGAAGASYNGLGIYHEEGTASGHGPHTIDDTLRFAPTISVAPAETSRFASTSRHPLDGMNSPQNGYGRDASPLFGSAHSRRGSQDYFSSPSHGSKPYDLPRPGLKRACTDSHGVTARALLPSAETYKLRRVSTHSGYDSAIVEDDAGSEEDWQDTAMPGRPLSRQALDTAAMLASLKQNSHATPGASARKGSISQREKPSQSPTGSDDLPPLAIPLDPNPEMITDDFGTYPKYKPESVDFDQLKACGLLQQTERKEGGVKRPINNYMLFARYRRYEIKSAVGSSIKTANISTMLAQEWAKMRANRLQDPWTDLWITHIEEFKRKNPGYQYKRAKNGARKRGSRGGKIPPKKGRGQGSSTQEMDAPGPSSGTKCETAYDDDEAMEEYPAESFTHSRRSPGLSMTLPSHAMPRHWPTTSATARRSSVQTTSATTSTMATPAHLTPRHTGESAMHTTLQTPSERFGHLALVSPGVAPEPERPCPVCAARYAQHRERCNPEEPCDCASGYHRHCMSAIRGKAPASYFS